MIPLVQNYTVGRMSGIGMNTKKKRILVILISFIFLFNINSSYVLSEENSVSFNISQQSSDPATYRAVLIGIGSIQGLPYSVRQIKGIQQTLLNGGNWEEEHIKLLTDDAATKENIQQNIAWLAESADENDVSLFYFIGHGGGGPNGSDHFISAADSIIYDENLSLYFENITGSLIVILDSCNSGGLINELWEPGRVIMTACAADESTYQANELKAPVFSYFFNISLSWITKNAEFTFLFTKQFTRYYGNKISDEYQADYSTTPQLYDGIRGPTWIINRHAYLQRIRDLINPIVFTHDDLTIWKMNT